MPIYVYKCRCGKTMERIHKISRVPKRCRCECGWMAKKTLTQSAVHGDTIESVKWLPSAIEVLQRDGERPITSMTEYKQYLKERKITPTG